MTLGEQVKEKRIQHHYSQSELSALSGLTVRTIQRIENNEGKPSLHSLKTLGEVLKSNFLATEHSPVEKAYEISFNVKISNMNQFVSDLKLVIQKNWKVILLVCLVIWLLNSYTDIKSGILDGWNSK